MDYRTFLKPMLQLNHERWPFQNLPRGLQMSSDRWKQLLPAATKRRWEGRSRALPPLNGPPALERPSQRRFVATSLTVHKLAYREHQKNYPTVARSQYYSNLINSIPGNSKQLFSVINNLLKPHNHICNKFTEEQCNSFIDHFTSKVTTICSSLAPPNSPLLDVPTLKPVGCVSQFLCVTVR